MSKSSVIDRRGSPICVAPIERHEFAGVDFLCSVCGRPRAMHYHDGFIPRPSTANRRTETLSNDPSAVYRGPHPRWTRPGQYIRPDYEERQSVRTISGHKAGGQRPKDATREHGTTAPQVRRSAAAP